ncbi:MAG: CobD/CbiB family cobalamin biosynthesis protein, partial [Acidimicrobiia bacterium]
DVAHLDRAEVARAAIESVAENTVDAVVAPALWALVGGARVVFAYRAVNTLDSMVGYRDPRYARFGWAAARADDVANWVPARLTAFLVAASRPRRAATVWRTVRRDAPAHPSPNAGVAEAAFAGALGLRLGGPTVYRGRSDPRPYLGDGRDPAPEDIADAVRLSDQVTVRLGGALVASALVLRTRAPKRRSDAGRR